MAGIAGKLGVGDGGQRPARMGCGLTTSLWRLREWVVMLEEATGGCIYRRARRGDRAPPEGFWTRRPATNGISERGRRRCRSRGHYGRAETST